MTPAAKGPVAVTARVAGLGMWTRPCVVTGLLVFAGLVSVMLFPGSMTLLGINDSGRWFLDSFAILAANDAVRLGLDPLGPNPIDILGRGHVYSDWWLFLGHLGLTRDHNFWFGITSVGLFLLVALVGLKPGSYQEALLATLMMLSPPFLMAINRANNDLLIFALVGGGLLLLQPAMGAWRWCVLGVAVALATGLKYYPLVAMAAFGLMVRPMRLMLVITSGVGLLVLGALNLVADDVPWGMFELPESVYIFGAPELLRDLALGRLGTTLLALLIIGLVGCGLAAKRITSGLADEDTGSIRMRMMFAMGALLLTGCFIAGNSYAYRWIFALWLWPWLWQRAQGGTRSQSARLALILAGISLWADGLFCLSINLWGALNVETYERWREAWMYCTHPVNWLLMGLLAGWLIDALGKTLRTLHR